MKTTEQKNAIEQVRKVKAKLGDSLLILTHHYQNSDIVLLGDAKGDSFDLSKKAAENESARTIIFCGVHFMAESAAILARPDQEVRIPDPEAGCLMADMADIIQVTDAWGQLCSITGQESFIPVVYMNSDAQIKAFCGEHRGTVCTSSNAHRAFSWVFSQGCRVFFLPDRHLGYNTARKLGIDDEKIIVWDPGKPLGGNTREQIMESRAVLWKGHCYVHTKFTKEDVSGFREKHPGSLVVVHPECPADVVDAADAAGSTNFIVEFVKKAPRNSIIGIGTEINLVTRLADGFPDKTVLPVARSGCVNMHKITPEKLLECIADPKPHHTVTVEQEIKSGAKKALDRMLSLPG